MKKRFARVAILVITGITAGFTPGGASADIISGTITGVLAVRPDNNAWNNQDILDFFGGGNLNGDNVTVTYSYDTAVTTLTSNSTVAEDIASGQLTAGEFSISVTVNGITVSGDGTGNHAYDFKIVQQIGAGITNNAFSVSTSGSGSIQLSNS